MTAMSRNRNLRQRKRDLSFSGRSRRIYRQQIALPPVNLNDGQRVTNHVAGQRMWQTAPATVPPPGSN
jgi:hypothetical protein